MNEYTGTATYSPEDNKLRLYPFARLDAETYARVKSAGFAWAPKQELFVAPMWTPSREDLLLELCGEIDDEDTSLVDRAEERAERFEDYSEKRATDADRAREAVAAIADGIPFGQPILVGHHSERHARKDAERIQNGMRKAVQMWRTSEYWTSRAAGALRHAKYKELPAVRHRRIKGLEADKRKQERTIAELEKRAQLWRLVETPEMLPSRGGVQLTPAEFALYIMHSYATGYEELERGEITAEQAMRNALESIERSRAFHDRWIEHYANRIAYERAMLDEAGGIPAERWNLEVGGRVLRRGEWSTILRVNRVAGVVSSVTTNARYVSKCGVEEITDYREPDAAATAAVKKATKLAPLCNYPSEGCRQMTAAEFKSGTRASDFWRIRPVAADDKYTAHRRRYAPAGDGRYWEAVPVFLTDEKVKFPAAADEVQAVQLEENAPESPAVAPPAIDVPEYLEAAERRAAAREERAADTKAAEFRALADAVKAGVQVVTAPQLFPTPADLAARVVDVAGIEDGMRVLEPSAGTGNLADAIAASHPGVYLVCNEISAELVRILDAKGHRSMQGDFLELEPDALGKFDRIVMNPPFTHASDVRHIEHARKFLKPGGRLVAICADGPRQRETLRAIAENSGGWYEELPAGTFKSSGTDVRTALLCIEAEPAPTFLEKLDAALYPADEAEPEPEPIAIAMPVPTVQASLF